MKLSDEDRKDLYEYTRYFALKALHIIVTSRTGHKDSTPCRIKSDWFNLNVSSEISSGKASKLKAVSNQITWKSPVCVEILLVTPDAQTLVLETWCICLLPEQSDPSPQITNTVYNHMGILLKSLVSVTRVIPAYKVSQRQGADTYTILYRIYENDPETHTLGDGYKQVRIGQICTPVGVLQLSVAYRVQLIFSPKQSASRESLMLVKSDHFNTNLCPTRNQQGNDKQRRKSQSIKAAFADPRPPRSKEPVATIKPGGVVWNSKLYNAIVEGQEPTSTDRQTGGKETNINRKSKDLPAGTDEISPSASLVHKDKLERVRTYSANSEELSSSEKSSSNENMSMVLSKFNRQSFRRIGKSVHYPFATPTPKSELVKFYRECTGAPRLTSLDETPVTAEDIMDQLGAFELKVQEFDNMVKNLCESPDSDN